MTNSVGFIFLGLVSLKYLFFPEAEKRSINGGLKKSVHAAEGGLVRHMAV